MFDQFCSQTISGILSHCLLQRSHAAILSAVFKSHKFLVVSVLDTTSLVCTDMCKEEYILSIPVLFLMGGGGGGGGGWGIKLIFRNQRWPVKMMVLKGHSVAYVLGVLYRIQ